MVSYVRSRGIYAQRPLYQMSQFSGSEDDSLDEMGGTREKSAFKLRHDTCKVFITGVIGADLKENYLSNDHHVVNFPIAVQGHFQPVHDWEKTKNTETMWISAEAWDDEAKKVQAYSKGSKFAGMGTLLFNKWKDKVTGEERKMFKMRVLKVMSEEEVKGMFGEEEGDEEPFAEKEAQYEEEEPPYRPPAKTQQSAPPIKPTMKPPLYQNKGPLNKGFPDKSKIPF